MGDALCGPSNALQTFQKHTSVDRTLQQDRLRSQQSPSQGFRSDPGPNAGLLDPEFEAFQAGNVTTFPEPSVLNTPQVPFPHGKAQSFSPQHVAPDWANDFQRLQISQPSHLLLAQQNRPIHHQSPPDWHLDFQRQQQQQAAPSYQQTQSPYLNRQIGAFPYGANGSLTSPVFGQQTQQPSLQYEEETQQSRELERAAFEREFEAHDLELLRMEMEVEPESIKPIAPSTELGQDVLISQGTTEETTRGMTDRPAPRIETDHNMHPYPFANLLLAESDRSMELHEADQEMNQTSRLEDDELAQTAGELLERVSDNQTQKFQESSFLSFMRKLRDKEVRVEGDQVVDVEVSTSSRSQSPSQHTTPGDSSTRPGIRHFHKSPPDFISCKDPTSARTESNHLRIPPEEQDEDQGKDMKMAGALPSDGDNNDAADDDAVCRLVPYQSPGVGWDPLVDWDHYHMSRQMPL